MISLLKGHIWEEGKAVDQEGKMARRKALFVAAHKIEVQRSTAKE